MNTGVPPGLHESPLSAGLWLGPGRSDGGAAVELAGNLSASGAGPGPGGHNVPALVLGVLLIVVIGCGNLLVCLSVLTERALKTTTNYFIVSLAVADLMLAVLVLPLFVYSEVRRNPQNRALRIQNHPVPFTHDTFWITNGIYYQQI